MKKSVWAVCLAVLAATAVQAETLKMKSGDLISGSILSQTEYTLNLATSYGNITLNQREIEQSLPDKHRMILKGGTQLVGVILDMDEFNLKLQTDDGNTVNVDMPQIVSIETYDYDHGKNAQQEFVQENIERQQAQAAAAQALAARQQATGNKAQAPAVEAACGLSFDADIDQVFDAKKATVVNGAVVTPQAQIEVAAPRRMTDEEAFLNNQPVTQETVHQTEPVKPASKKPQAVPTKKNEKAFSKYFAIEAGAMPLDLNVSGTLSLGDLGKIDLGDQNVDVGGTSAVVSSKFLWRVKETNLWVGPALSVANIANNSHTDSASTISATSSGNILTFGLGANYYLNPNNRFVFYLTGTASYEMLTLNYRGSLTTAAAGELPFRDSIKSNGFAGGIGLGVETWIDDIMLGLEARQVCAQRSGELKNSSSSNTVIQAQISWKF